MRGDSRLDLLKLLWRRAAEEKLDTVSGGVVNVRAVGEYDQEKGLFVGAEVVVDDVVSRGDVIISVGEDSPMGNYENCILQVVPFPTNSIIKLNGSILPQAILKPLPISKLAFETIREGSGSYGCAVHLRKMKSHRRVGIFTRLLSERLIRKCDDVEQILEENGGDWNQTMYMMLLRTMGDSKNKEAFTELARRVRYVDISRERETVTYVEAMLMGTSGLLEIYDEDSYVRSLKESFAYLQKKYNISPMRAGEWVLSRVRAANQPVLRMAQLASFLTQREFIFDRMLEIKTIEDVYDYFIAEASDYWTAHTLPGVRADEGGYIKRVGRFKADVLAINLTVPMMFSYGRHMKDESLTERALELLEKINREDNSIVNGWYEGGVVIESAFDSQALIQLTNEYCKKEQCWCCPIGRQVVAQAIEGAQI